MRFKFIEGTFMPAHDINSHGLKVASFDVELHLAIEMHKYELSNTKAAAKDSLKKAVDKCVSEVLSRWAMSRTDSKAVKNYLTVSAKNNEFKFKVRFIDINPEIYETGYYEIIKITKEEFYLAIKDATPNAVTCLIHNMFGPKFLMKNAATM